MKEHVKALKKQVLENAEGWAIDTSLLLKVKPRKPRRKKRGRKKVRK